MADTPDIERYDPTRLIGRVTVVVLALAGAALALAPGASIPPTWCVASPTYRPIC